MNAPLLRLSADAWSLITSYLDFDDVKSLLLVGDGPVSKVVGSATQSFVINNFVHSAVDLESILLTAKATPNLQHLFINPTGYSYAVMKPLLPLSPSIFPPNLKTLEATFDNSLAFFMVTHNIAELAPGLTSLSLRATSADDQYNLRDLKLPPLLQKLVFGDAVVHIEDGEIATLPRSLTHLDIQAHYAPSMTENEWPPQLSTLRFQLLSDITVEHLPRTLTDLTLSGAVVTSFKPTMSEKNFAFPWRVFFPYLTHLRLQCSFIHSSLNIYRSILLPNAYDTNEVSHFLTRGFWHTPLLDMTPATGYPLFKRLYINTDQQGMLETVRSLAPLLRNVTHFSSPYYDLLPYLPSVTLCTASSHVKYTRNSPKHMKNVWFNVADVDVLEVLTSVEVVRIANFKDYEPAALKDVLWPSSLKSLEVAMPFDAPAIASLPTNLTSLNVQITDLEAWSMISSHMVTLSKLSITLSPDHWHNAECLTPITSTCLTNFNLIYEGRTTMCPNGPRLDEIFGSNSILPPSLQSLSINSRLSSHPVPISLISNLPPKLRQLSLTGHLTWNSKTENSDASPSSTMTPSKLFASLPTTLESFFLDPITHKHLEALKDVSVLSFLPPGLKGFAQHQVFVAPDSSNIDAIVHNLPPRLLYLSYVGQQSLSAPQINVSDIYFSKRRSYLYHGPEAPTTV